MTTMAELAQRIDLLTVEHLDVIVRDFSEAPFLIDRDFLVYGLSTEVLRFFLGNDWTNENVFSTHEEVTPKNRQGRAFLKTEATELPDHLRHRDRIVSLAEILFGMQHVPGIRHRTSLMEKDNLESDLGEFECAVLLAHPELQLRFVCPSGIKGQDYEAEVVTAGGRQVCCEIKTKSEDTPFDRRTVWNSLEEARKQLPRDDPGLILVKIPEEWVTHPSSREGCEWAIEKLFRQSHRVVSVILAWNEWWSEENDLHVNARRFATFENRRSDRFLPDIDELVSRVGRAQNPTWVSLPAFVDQRFQS